MGDRDEVILSEWERERLADIEQGLAGSDPRLKRHLTGSQAGFPAPTVAPVLLVVLGGAVAVATFTRSLWVATAGLVAMALGMGLGMKPAVAGLRQVAANRQRDGTSG